MPTTASPSLQCGRKREEEYQRNFSCTDLVRSITIWIHQENTSNTQDMDILTIRIKVMKGNTSRPVFEQTIILEVVKSPCIRPPSWSFAIALPICSANSSILPSAHRLMRLLPYYQCKTNLRREQLQVHLLWPKSRRTRSWKRSRLQQNIFHHKPFYELEGKSIRHLVHCIQGRGHNP